MTERNTVYEHITSLADVAMVDVERLGAIMCTLLVGGLVMTIFDLPATLVAAPTVLIMYWYRVRWFMKLYRHFMLIKDIPQPQKARTRLYVFAAAMTIGRVALNIAMTILFSKPEFGDEISGGVMQRGIASVGHYGALVVAGVWLSPSI